MKSKRKIIILLVMVMLMGLVLTGCNDRDDRDSGNSPTEINQPAPPRDQHPAHDRNRDPNRPPPERNPDGTIG